MPDSAQSDLAGDVQRRGWVVAGEHEHAHVSREAFPDGVRYAGTDWIPQSDEAEELPRERSR